MNRLQYLQNLHQEDPTDDFVLFAIAKEYENTQNFILALEYYLKLKSLNGNYLGLYYHLGKLYETLDKYDEALDTYSIGIELSARHHDQHAMAELMNAKTNLEMEL